MIAWVKRVGRGSSSCLGCRYGHLGRCHVAVGSRGCSSREVVVVVGRKGHPTGHRWEGNIAWEIAGGYRNGESQAGSSQGKVNAPGGWYRGRIKGYRKGNIFGVSQWPDWTCHITGMLNRGILGLSRVLNSEPYSGNS